MLVRDGNNYYFYDPESEYLLKIMKRSYYFQPWIELRKSMDSNESVKQKFEKEHYKIVDNLWKYLNRVGLYETPIFDSIKFNQRYKQTFNYIATKVSYDILDNKHKFLKLYHRKKYFNYHWDCFVNDYGNVKKFLEENLFARQMLLSFVTLFGKFNNIYKNKKFRWIIEETPEFYIKGFILSTWMKREKFIEDYRQNLGNNENFEESWRFRGSHSFCGVMLEQVHGKLHDFRDCPYDIKTVKDCLSFKCPKRKRETLSANEHYGFKNKTSEIVKLFNNQSCILNIHHVNLKTLKRFIKNEQCIQRITTNIYELTHQDTVPNMKYYNNIIRKVEKYIESSKKPSSEIIVALDKILNNIDYFKGDRQKLNVKRRIERLKFMLI